MWVLVYGPKMTVVLSTPSMGDIAREMKFRLRMGLMGRLPIDQSIGPTWIFRTDGEEPEPGYELVDCGRWCLPAGWRDIDTQELELLRILRNC